MTRGPKKQPKTRIDALYRRIVTRCDGLGKSLRAVSMDAGLGETFIKDIRRKGSMPSAENLNKIARALGVTTAWLIGDAKEAPAPSRPADAAPVARRAGGVNYIGEVAAGQWLEANPFEPDPSAIVPVFDVRYPAEAQYALGVRGTSINRIARPGTILLCVDISRGGVEISNGDLVVVQRRRGDGALVEVTAKRFRRRNASVVELVPESDDPRWRDPIVLDDAKAGEGEEVSVIALVTGVYRPISPNQEGSV